MIALAKDLRDSFGFRTVGANAVNLLVHSAPMQGLGASEALADNKSPKELAKKAV